MRYILTVSDVGPWWPDRQRSVLYEAQMVASAARVGQLVLADAGRNQGAGEEDGVVRPGNDAV